MRATLSAFCLALLLAGVARADSLYVRLVGRYDMVETAYGVAASGDYAYIANGDALRIVSVADPTQPVEVGYCDSPRSARGVAVSGDYVYVADAVAGLRVILVADPTNPVEVGRCPTPGAAIDIAVRGDYVFVADGDSGLRVISVADPSHPVEVGYCDTPGYAYNVHVSDGHAYVADGNAGVRIISVSDPARPTEVGYYYTPGGLNAVAADGEFAYVASAGTDSTFRVISVADPAHPVEVGRCYYYGNWPVAAPQDVKVSRGHAFLATWWGGLRIIEIADPTHPAEVGHYKLGQSWAVALDRDYVYFTAHSSLVILQFYQLGDLDVDGDSLDVVADTLRLRRWATVPGEFVECALGEFILANTSLSYNPDPIDGPSVSPVESLSFAGSLTGPGGTIDSIVILNLPESVAQGQTLVCTLTAHVPVGLKVGNYTGSIYISGKDTAGLQVYESCYVFLQKLGDIDVDDDSLDVVADTVRVPPSYSAGLVRGRFVLVNTSGSYNPDTADGPSLSCVDSLRFTASLVGPGGTIDSVRILNLPESLAQGQSAVCTLAVYVPDSLPVGDYTGSIVITGLDSVRYPVAETVYALVTKEAAPEQLGDLDIDSDSLDVVHDTMNVRVQPGGSPSSKARFVLVNTSSTYNPDAEDGPSRSPLREIRFETGIEKQNGSIDSVRVLNLPESLAVGQAVECTLALFVPAGESLGTCSGHVTISGFDSLGYTVRDSFVVVASDSEPAQSPDSFCVAPIPFKPHQNPEHDAIHFQGLSAGARVTVYDASGQTVWSETEKGDGHLAWDAKVASGIYVYLVVATDGTSRVGKLSVIR